MMLLYIYLSGKGDGMSFKYFREIDRLGRVVIPMDIRKSLSISAGDVLKISSDTDRIILQKAENQCVFCGSTEDLTELERKFICQSCISRLMK